MQVSQHRQLPASPLAPYVRCYWEYVHQVPPGVTLDVPSGCLGHSQLIFCLSNNFRATYLDGTAVPAYTNALPVQPLRPLNSHRSGYTWVVVIEFAPTGLHALWNLPLANLTDTTLDLSALEPTSLDELTDQLQAASDPTQRFGLLDHWLIRRLGRVRSSDRRMEAAARQLQQPTGPVDLGQLAYQLNCSERTLRRRFANEIGLSPKLYARVHRFLHVQERLSRQTAVDWHSLIGQTGYYDQAHLINDFREFTGKPPLVYQQTLAGAIDFLRETNWACQMQC